MNATLRRRRNLVTAVAKSATSLAIVPLPVPMLEQRVESAAAAQVWVDTLAVVEVVAGRNATNAARSDILLVIAPKVAVEADTQVDIKLREVMVAEVLMVVEAYVKAVRHAIHAAVTVTCLAIAPKARNATTVRRDPWSKPRNQIPCG